MKKPITLLFTAAFGLALLSPVADAGQGDRVRAKAPKAVAVQRHVERKAGSVDITGTTGDGRTFERHVSTVKTEDGYTRTTTGTTPNGDAYDRNVTFSRDKEAGTWSKEVSGTTPSGNTFSTSISGQRTEDGYTRHAEHTGANGTVATRDTVAKIGEDGKVSKDVTNNVTPPQNPVDAGE